MGKEDDIASELERIQVLAHLLQKAGESESGKPVEGWAVEGAGKMILRSASEAGERLADIGRGGRP